MNDPKDMPIDDREMAAWMVAHKNETGLSWKLIGDRSGMSSGMLHSFVAGNYRGNVETVAKRVFQYRQKVESQSRQMVTKLTEPGYIATPTGDRVLELLQEAQSGRIVAAGMGPGTGKTKAAKHFKGSMGGTTWLVTLRETTGTVHSMIHEIHRVMKLSAKGYGQAAAAEVLDHIRGKDGVLIIDEANHATLKMLEELRAWHDETGVGLALFGNDELIRTIQSGPNAHALARLESRIAMMHEQDLPIEEDVERYLDAFDIIEPDMRRPLIKVGTSRGHGGLREVSMVLQSANRAAIGLDETLNASHIERALAFRRTTQRRYV